MKEHHRLEKEHTDLEKNQTELLEIKLWSLRVTWMDGLNRWVDIIEEKTVDRSDDEIRNCGNHRIFEKHLMIKIFKNPVSKYLVENALVLAFFYYLTVLLNIFRNGSRYNLQRSSIKCWLGMWTLKSDCLSSNPDSAI